jgi:hypothetical protein
MKILKIFQNCRATGSVVAWTIRRIAPTFFLSSILYFSILFCASAAPIEGNTKSVSGKVEFAAPGATAFKALKAGQALPVGSTIKTGPDGVAIILTVPGAAIRVGPDSQLIIQELDFEKGGAKQMKRKATLDLKTGTVSALIEGNMPETTDFRIKTPQGIAAARGTFYGVTVVDGKAHVAVQEGKVGIQSLKEAKSSEKK